MRERIFIGCISSTSSRVCTHVNVPSVVSPQRSSVSTVGPHTPRPCIWVPPNSHPLHVSPHASHVTATFLSLSLSHCPINGEPVSYILDTKERDGEALSPHQTRTHRESVRPALFSKRYPILLDIERENKTEYSFTS
jgi:hypothetical protein